MIDGLEDLLAVLKSHGQQHLLAFHDQLPPSRLSNLINQIRLLDFDEIDGLIDQYVRHTTHAGIPSSLEPAPLVRVDVAETAQGIEARKHGEQLIADGRIAAFTVAGGQGTRLGWNGPKGTYPATAVTGKPLFRLFAEQILAAQRRWKTTIPWYIMTSPLNDADTRAFFLDNNCFGLRRNNIMMFPQGTMPSFELETGKLFLTEPDAIAVNPDGHGGSFRALHESGAIEDMQGRQIEHISYTQVDNPLAQIIDPLFIGLHASSEYSDGNMSSKVVRKTDPEEKVGVVCTADDKTIIVEYSDLPAALATTTDSDGNLRFIAGSIAIHLMSVPFAAQFGKRDTRTALPYHRAVKTVPMIDPKTGERHDPEIPNAVKLELFVFDALAHAGRSLVLETRREEEFAPIKNRIGADSAATSHQLQSDLYATWLEAHKVNIPRDNAGHTNARIEISPLTAMAPADLAETDLPRTIAPGDSFVI